MWETEERVQNLKRNVFYERYDISVRLLWPATIVETDIY